MCWSFLIDIVEDKYHKQIQTLKELMDLFKEFNLEFPEEILKLYEKEDIKTGAICMCPINLKYFGDDKLTGNLINTFGDKVFRKINEKEIKIQYDTIKDKHQKTILIKDLNPKYIFNKIIYDIVAENNKTLILSFW